MAIYIVCKKCNKKFKIENIFGPGGAIEAVEAIKKHKHANPLLKIKAEFYKKYIDNDKCKECGKEVETKKLRKHFEELHKDKLEEFTNNEIQAIIQTATAFSEYFKLSIVKSKEDSSNRSYL